MASNRSEMDSESRIFGDKGESPKKIFPTPLKNTASGTRRLRNPNAAAQKFGNYDLKSPRGTGTSRGSIIYTIFENGISRFRRPLPPPLRGGPPKNRKYGYATTCQEFPKTRRINVVSPAHGWARI